MERRSYTFGDVVLASQISIENRTPDVSALEFKLWLRLPDGRVVPANNLGADGSFVFPGQTTHNFGPLTVMGVGADVAPGIWELGCRLLDPATGQQIYEHNDLFEIR